MKLRYPLQRHNTVLPQSDDVLRVLWAFQLPRSYREVFLLKEIQGYTFAEIAAILGIRVETALARLECARREIGRVEDSVAMEPAS